MSFGGAAIVAGALAKGALTVGLMAQGHDDYFLGVDCVGAEPDYTPETSSPFFDRRQYWTSVAAGITVASIFTIGGGLIFSKGRR